MRAQETTLVVRYVKACCPAQQIDEYTPDAWHDVIGDLRFEDCKEAVRNLAREQSFVDTKDIRREVRRIRERRIADHPPVDPPPELDEAGYRTWLITTRRAIADGEVIVQPELPTRNVAALIPGWRSQQ